MIPKIRIRTHFYEFMYTQSLTHIRIQDRKEFDDKLELLQKLTLLLISDLRDKINVFF